MAKVSVAATHSVVDLKKIKDSRVDILDLGTQYQCSLKGYLENKEYSLLKYGNYEVVWLDSQFTLALTANKIYAFWSASPIETLVSHLNNANALKHTTEAGIFIENYKKPLANFKKIVLINADENDLATSLVQIISDDWNMPIFSFACLRQFYAKKSDPIAAIINGKIKLMDFMPAEVRDLTKAQKEQLKSKKEKEKLIPPEHGFSLIRNQWHRSGTVLFHDTTDNICILLGQDEGTYFGVELPKPCKTIPAAFEMLVPKEVKGKPYSRQGEWFIVNVDPKSVPEIYDCILCGISLLSEELCLPYEENGNKHIIGGIEIRVSKDGIVYVDNPALTHDDHNEVSRKGWCTFYKNTAVRSFSQEGVD